MPLRVGRKQKQSCFFGNHCHMIPITQPAQGWKRRGCRSWRWWACRKELLWDKAEQICPGCPRPLQSEAARGAGLSSVGGTDNVNNSAIGSEGATEIGPRQIRHRAPNRFNVDAPHTLNHAVVDGLSRGSSPGSCPHPGPRPHSLCWDVTPSAGTLTPNLQHANRIRPISSPHSTCGRS